MDIKFYQAKKISMLKSVAILLCLSCFSSWGHDLLGSVTDSLDPSWKANASVMYSEDRPNGKGYLATSEIFGKFKWKIHQKLSFHGELLFVDRRGFIQSIFDRSDRGNSFYFVEAYLKWNLFSDVYLRAGNKNQVFLEAPLLISDKTFSSFAVGGDLKFFENISLQGILQMGVPNNAEDFIERETDLLEHIPRFHTASAFFNWERVPFLFGSNLKNNLTFFHFTELPAPVANKSEIWGNSVPGGGSNAQLEHEFYGFHNTVQTRVFPSSQWIVEVGYDYLYNFGAPRHFNKGERFFSSIYYDFYEFMEIKLTGAYFANQPDSAVAFYNTELYGHNNRRGWFAKLEGHLYDSGITVGVSYTDSQPISDEKSIMGNAYSIIFSVGTNYVQI